MRKNLGDGIFNQERRTIMREVPITEVAHIITEKLSSGGVFLTSNAGGQPNVMTLGWGGVTQFFSVPCFIAPVRDSRFTYGILRKAGAFTVSIPLHDMKPELMLAGTRSGRDINKFDGQGMTAAPAQQVHAPIVAECELHVECESMGYVRLNPDTMSDLIMGRWYPSGDMHTLFLGKVVRCYYTQEPQAEP